MSCPFCGSSAVQVVDVSQGERNRLAILCNSCEAMGPPVDVSRAKEALDRWNRRAG
jgi:Lar family restriction alleviation protein